MIFPIRFFSLFFTIFLKQMSMLVIVFDNEEEVEIPVLPGRRIRRIHKAFPTGWVVSWMRGKLSTIE